MRVQSMRWQVMLSLGAAVTAGAAARSFSQGSGYHLLRRVVLGGEGKWDYLTMDPVRRRVFIAHGTEVLVVDADRAAVLGKIPDTPGVHGVALAQGLGRGFTSNGADSTVTIFDLASLKILSRVTVTGRKPDAIVYDSVSGRVFTFNGGSDNATAIEASTGKIVGTVALGGAPEFAVADGRGRIFVNLEDRSALLSFDTRTLEPGATWPLAPCDMPSGLAIDRGRHRLFSGCANRLMAVVDAKDGHVLATVSIGARVDANAFDSTSGLAFSSNGDGTLTVVDVAGSTFRVVQTVQTELGARTMAFDPKTHNIFLVTAQFGPTPRATEANPRPRPPTIPGTFTLLIFGR
jgi:DNA-binding beta-propeller fold protein YncE